MKTIYFVVLIVTLVTSACKTNLVYINAINPSPVSISKLSKNVGIVSRTTPSEENKILNTIHQNRSGETLQLIKDASSESTSGLFNALIENNRFDSITLMKDVELKTPVSGTFASPLTWAEVEKIGKPSNIDLLFVLEIMDSELKIVPINTPTKIDNVTDVLNAAIQAQVNINTTVKTGWRIYDLKNKIILDEYPLTDNLSITANASTIINTTEAMLGRKEAIKQSANRLGRAYASRVIPHGITVTRDYYVKGSQNLKIATRKARTGNWDGAGELWLKDTESTKRKVAGRACYNMAILGEINGDLDLAITWAQKAYENYNNKLALQYVNVLRNRKRVIQKLDYQIGN